MSEISNLITELGFPSFVCLGFGWYITKRDAQRAELEKENKERMYEDRTKLIESIENYRVTSNKLLETNREMSETNRLLANEIKDRMNIVENTLIEINHKITKK